MSDNHNGSHGLHITSVHTLVATFVALVALTILTSVMANYNLGRADIWVTLGIATVKAGLVIAIFMHLIHDKAFNGIVLFGTFLFVGLFLGFVLTDSEQYQPQIKAYSETVRQEQADLAP